jgi:DNA-binding response OmpR family regulator
MKRAKGKILWADDEIEHLKPHLMFLEERGFSVTGVANADDAVGLLRKERFDLVLLDEMMPGKDGIQALQEIRQIAPGLPVIMVTKSEEENLMEEAIGGEIADYLTKPVNPSQILSSCKRILEKQRISRDKIARDYTAEFGEITSMLEGEMSPSRWIDLHVRLSEREIELDAHPDLGLDQTLQDQRRECNLAFGRYIENEYVKWIRGVPRPVLSVDVLKHSVVPHLLRGDHVLLILIDNLRLDQWLTLEPLVYEFYNVSRDYYFSILPTATPYSRNAIFSGLFPSELEAFFPDLYRKGDSDELSRNRYEHQMMAMQLERLDIRLKPEPRYVKIMTAEEARQVENAISSYLTAPLSALVFNFMDIVAHRRSDSPILREIVPDEAAFRSLTRTWFEHSSLFQILRNASKSGVRIVITSDHGSIRSKHGSTVYADKETSTNVRYKYGRGIRGEAKQALEVRNPREYGLPELGININYLIAKEDFYFVYPTNYHKYLALYRDSFQHGGISLEEMVLPVITLEGRN